MLMYGGWLLLGLLVYLAYPVASFWTIMRLYGISFLAALWLVIANWAVSFLVGKVSSWLIGPLGA